MIAPKNQSRHTPPKLITKKTITALHKISIDEQRALFRSFVELLNVGQKSLLIELLHLSPPADEATKQALGHLYSGRSAVHQLAQKVLYISTQQLSADLKYKLKVAIKDGLSSDHLVCLVEVLQQLPRGFRQILHPWAIDALNEVDLPLSLLDGFSDDKRMASSKTKLLDLPPRTARLGALVVKLSSRVLRDDLRLQLSTVSSETFPELVNVMLRAPRAWREKALPHLEKLAKDLHAEVDLSTFALSRQGLHWKERPNQEPMYLVDIRGVGRWEVGLAEVLAATHLKTRNALELRITKGGGKATMKVHTEDGEEIYTISRLRQTAAGSTK